MAVHVPWKIAVIVSSVLVLIITVSVSLAYVTNQRTEELDYYVTKFIGQPVFSPSKYWWLDPDSSWGEFGPLVTDIFHPGWLSATMYVVIWVFTAAWIVYAHFTLCMHSSPTTYLYDEPEYIPWFVYVGTMVNLVLTCLYIYVTSWIQIWQSLLLLLVQVIVGAVILCLAMRALERAACQLKLAGKASEICWTIGLAHNSIAFYTTWLLISFHQNLAMVLVFNLGVSMYTACTVVLCIALAFIIVLFVMENFVSYKRLKYIYGTWVCVIISLIAIISCYFEKNNGNHVFVLILLMLAIFGLVFKCGLYCFRRKDKQEDKCVGQQRSHFVTTIPPAITMPPTINKSPVSISLPNPEPSVHATYVPHTYTNPAVVNECTPAPVDPTVVTQFTQDQANPTVITPYAPGLTNPTVVTQCTSAPTNPTVITQCTPDLTNPPMLTQLAPGFSNPPMVTHLAPGFTNPPMVTQLQTGHSTVQPLHTHATPVCDPLVVTNHYHVKPVPGSQVVVGSGGFYNFS